ncbi:DUF2057 domain-containing protein [Salmonella enterica subsp. indica]|uniref:Uncharacterized protein conserved in bacteria (DUF2057) n=2 Tax=Salmonella enterica TaxID=28901 RepID=A0A379XMQ9_SALER|nr:DUF2057 family protein [Salmonella enterica]EBP3211293.1 DUF2057 domain-containing protein [Salmonella enterica subsp. arizonae]ECI8273733.1 DUF2057 domain-containing protein [Salmonella enterica subsp. enterica]EDR2772761.1 DUF2057 domain-containing protein [Salmonella enterica subsp. enterica serovar Oslo]EEC4249885.1 DUF2057 domain-containing protein [Salmonella enterica subsp. diarizonae]ECC3878930.1 DUF2057 domain-containing protein [Salmonella enterica subsp. indica]
MKKYIMSAATLLFCSQALAAPHLFIGDNVSVLAARSAKVSIFSKDVMLTDGTQKMVVKFDSPVNPESVNNNRGRVTSNPYILSFNASGNTDIQLSTGKPLDEKEASLMAQKPVFTLTAGGKPVPFDIKILDRDSITVFTDLSAIVNDDGTMIPSQARATAPEATSISSHDQLSQLQQLYLKADDSQKKAFLKWALNL